MNKKGFTLIELLAVIVIIALITLITIPVIGNIIEKSKKDAFERSIEGLSREYAYKEVQTNDKLGEVNACTLQEECKLQGIINRDSNNDIIVTISNGKYCGAGKIGDLTITEGRCDINLGTALVSDISPVDYDGTTQEPEVEVILGGVTLVENVDYEVSYENNINAGLAMVIITGKGDYKGSITKTFTINRIEDPNSEILGANLTYNGLSQSLITSVNISNSNVYYNVGTELNSSNYNTLGSLERPSEVSAGTYTVYYYAPASGNYNEVKGSVVSVINKITPTMNLSSYSGTYYVGYNETIIVTGNYGTLSCESSNEAKVTCSVENNTITINPVAVGSTTLTITSIEDDNYLGSVSKTYNVTIQMLPTIDTCPDCVYMYTTNDVYYGGNYTPSILSSDQYKINYKDVVEASGYKWFLGFKLDSNGVVEKAYTCGLIQPGTSSEKAFCLRGYTNGDYYNSNSTILLNTFGANCNTSGQTQCNSNIYGVAYIGGDVVTYDKAYYGGNYNYRCVVITDGIARCLQPNS